MCDTNSGLFDKGMMNFTLNFTVLIFFFSKTQERKFGRVSDHCHNQHHGRNLRQPASSSPRGQSGTPSHSRRDGTQPWEGHRNSAALQEPGAAGVGICTGQLISSLPSAQSSGPSHRAAGGRHCGAYAHGNAPALQVGGRGPAEPAGGKGKVRDSALSVVIHTAFETDRNCRECS